MRVEWVDNLTKRSTSNTVSLNGSHQHNLANPDGQDALCMDQAWVAQVVKSTLTEDLGSSFEPHSLTKLDTVTGQELREDTSKSTKHSLSAVDHLEFTVLGKGFRLGDSPENGPKYLTRSGPYHELLDEADLETAFLIVILPFPVISEEDGESLTACPEKEGEERAIVEAAMVYNKRKVMITHNYFTRPSNNKSSRFSFSGDKICGIRPGVVINRVCKVVSKVLQWTLSGNNGLNEESKHREHSKSTVLDLLYLELSKRLWIISKT
ncbi:hypothetical protein H5410_007400 [Solanum commersonii]|uniref:Uncharacterized protein n=1 Tax=Solanum commersonii TaxID=4109 RepID=A0A9J6ABW1_SOLCO|nr:hypothetical protein H5410_007400 [Solanum commersonii]